MTRTWLVLLSLLSNILALALPLTLIQVYDRILANQAMGTAVVLFSAVVIAINLDGNVKFARSAIIARLGAGSEHRLAMDMARQVMAMRRKDLRGVDVGQIRELFATISRSRDVLVGQSTLALFDAPFAVVFLVLVWFIGGPLVLVPLVIVSAVGLLAIVTALRNRRAVSKQFDARSAHKLALHVATSKAEILRTRGLAGGLMSRLRRSEISDAEATERSERHTASLQDFTQVAALATSVGVLGYGALLSLDGAMTSGGIAACLILGQRAVAALVGIVAGLARRQTA
ncbi:MAG: ABC transporter transmembrane domain-containing protein, partial [Rhodospirillaceae bacterium]